jgi:hypothetical protein
MDESAPNLVPGTCLQDHALRGLTGGSKAEIDITSERRRSDELKTTETFLRLKKQALTLIREEAIKATQHKE